MIKRYILSCLLIFPLILVAQESNELLNWADMATKEKDYQAACYFYQKYITKENPTDARIYFLYADALRLSYLYNEAEYMFEKGLLLDSNHQYPEGLFLSALVKKNNAKYTEALQLLEKYQLINKTNTSLLSKRLAIELKACRQAPIVFNDTLPVLIERLPQNINTPYSEFNAIQLKDTALYFSALLPFTKSENISIIEDFYISAIYSTRFEVNGFSTPKLISKKINNPKYHNANFCFNHDKSKIYFSRTPNGKKTGIWVAEWGKKNWKNPKPLPSSVNYSGFNNTQPSIIQLDEETDVLYFVSDRPGGIGEMDIWYVIINNNQFGEAINLGSNINTPGNEITPFYYSNRQTLYFSSDWHEGLGGYDIFKAKGAMSAWENPENIGFPLNSPANDIYFTINEVDSDGYFSSNRASAYGIENATCCNDIFQFEWSPIKEKSHSDTLWTKDSIGTEQLLTKILPINLYFHNDEPDPKTLAITTDKDYKQTLDEYIALHNLYQEEYSKGLESKEKEEAVLQIDNFFNDYVLKGYDLLEQLTTLLLRDLQRGKSINITVSGFASPLFSDDYNINLSLRRIESLRNYLKIYENGIFIPYMDGTKENQLKIINAPKGKTMAKEYVSDNPNDKRNSIYSMAAALERRIQIFGYDEDTIISLQKDFSLSLPDSILTFSPLSDDITTYIKYIEIKNWSKDTIILENKTHPSNYFSTQLEKNIVLPKESVFLTLTFYYRIFKISSTNSINLVAKKANLKKDIRIECIFKQ